MTIAGLMKQMQLKLKNVHCVHTIISHTRPPTPYGGKNRAVCKEQSEYTVYPDTFLALSSFPLAGPVTSRHTAGRFPSHRCALPLKNPP